jgi:gliding motility-associated-like protein
VKQNDEIKEFFSQKLTNHEAPVNPELWNSISKKIGSSTIINSTVSKGVSLSFKTVFSVLTIASVSIGSVYFLTRNDENLSEKGKQKNSNFESFTKDVENTKLNTTENHSVQSKNKTKKPKAIITENVFENSSLESYVENIFKPDLVINKKESEDLENVIANSNLKHEDGQKTSTIQNDNHLSTRVLNPENNEGEIKLPNIVTPNNDGENDLFWIGIKNVQDFSITILNDKNKVVFTTTDPDFKWDCRDFQQNLVPVGNYVYYFSGKDVSGNMVSKSSKLYVKY